uniref:MSV199 domain-containing protein n=1 Tax=viral metagenome TaxID=1070528 RepID=A0A6C0C9B1_9ZZZZ
MDSLLSFLETYSDVDVAFIKEFIEIRQGDQKSGPFRIYLDSIFSWLKVCKDHLKVTLTKTYTEKIDYIILPIDREVGKVGGPNKEIILITEDCFKAMCVRSSAKDAEKIRYYYITLEKLVDVYKDEIIQNQQKHIEKLKHNMKKYKYPVKGALYVIAVDDGHKLGRTDNLNKRLPVYDTAHKDKPEVKYVFYTDDVVKLENCVKNILRDQEYRDRKEFYMIELVDIINAIEGCHVLITNFSCSSCGDKENITKLKKHVTEHGYETDKVKFGSIIKYHLL